MISMSAMSGPTRQQMVDRLRTIAEMPPAKAVLRLAAMLDEIDNGPVRIVYEGGPPKALRRIKQRFKEPRREKCRA